MPNHVLHDCALLSPMTRSQLFGGVAGQSVSSRTVRAAETKSRKRQTSGQQSSIEGYFDTKQLSDDEWERYVRAIIKFIIHSSSSFRIVEELRREKISQHTLRAAQEFDLSHRMVTRGSDDDEAMETAASSFSPASSTPADTYELTREDLMQQWADDDDI